MIYEHNIIHFDLFCSNSGGNVNFHFIVFCSALIQNVKRFLVSLTGRYHLAWLACTMTMQRLCFALPLTLSTPAAVILIVSNRCENSYLPFLKCSQNSQIWLYISLISVALWLGQFFATTYYAWKNQDFIMANEAVLFWTPSYEGKNIDYKDSKNNDDDDDCC